MAYDNEQGRSGGNGGYPKKPYQGKKNYGNKPGSKPYGDKKPYGDRKPYGDKPQGERTYGDKKPYGDRKPYGDKPYGERKPYGDKPQGDRNPYGDKPYGDRKPYGDKPYGDRKPYGDKPQGERTYGDKKPYGDRKPYGDKPYGDRKPYGDKPYGDRKPYGDKPQGDRKPYGDKPYDKRKPYERSDAPGRSTEETGPVQEETDELPFLIIGRNAVREAVKAGRSIDRIMVQTEQDGSLREILSMARDAKLVIREAERKKLDEVCMPFGHGGKTANHQGIVAYAAGVSYCDVKDILALAKERGEDPFVVVLDGVMDPHNLGSILRSADCAGAHGVIIGKRRSASVTAAAVKAAAGAAEHVLVARVTNLNAALTTLKKAGVWIAGADMKGRPMERAALAGPLALVIGNEGEGISKLVSDSCDFLVSIPMTGHVGSLNASVAAGVLLFEKRRQDGAKKVQA